LNIVSAVEVCDATEAPEETKVGITIINHL